MGSPRKLAFPFDMNGAEPILREVAVGSYMTIRKLLQDLPRAQLKAFFQLHDEEGCTPLHMACRKGHLELVKLFIEEFGANVSDIDEDQKRKGNALHYACWGGHLEIVNYLIDQCGADIGALDIVENTPILYAIYGGHLPVVLELLRRGRTLQERNAKHHTAILQASCGGHVEIVRYLLRNGATVLEKDTDGNTALLFAAWGGHIGMMDFLLKSGACLREKNAVGHNIFLSAANGGKKEVVEWCLNNGFNIKETNNNGDTALLLAAYGGHIEVVEYLLGQGSSLKERNNCGFTALLSAANGGHKEMSAWLIEHNASLSEVDQDGYSCLVLAACAGNLDTVKYFVDRGSSIAEQNRNGDTPLLLACYCGHVELVDWLLQHGSSLQEKNKTGMNALISAANGGNASMVEYLLRIVPSSVIDEVDNSGYTPFLLSVHRGHLAVAQLLAAYGANIRHVTHHLDALTLASEFPDLEEYLRYIWAFTPMQIAVDARHVDRIHELLVRGVDPTFTPSDPHYVTLTTLAQKQGQYKGSLPPSDEVTRLVQRMHMPWTPSAHGFMFGPRLTAAAKSLFLLQHCKSRSSDLPFLPSELWFHICSFLQRSWYPDFDASYIGPNDPVSSSVQDRLRSWRKRRLLLQVSEEAPMKGHEYEEEDVGADLNLPLECLSFSARNTVSSPVPSIPSALMASQDYSPGARKHSTPQSDKPHAPHCQDGDDGDDDLDTDGEPFLDEKPSSHGLIFHNPFFTKT